MILIPTPILMYEFPCLPHTALPPHRTKKFSNTRWVSHNSTQFCCYLPGGNIISPKLWAQSCKSASTPILRGQLPAQVITNRLQIGGSNTPSLGLINLLKWLTKLREILYLPNYRFTVKWFNSRTARWKRCIGQGMGKLLRASKPSSQPLIRVHRPGSSPVELLWRLLTQAWFIKSTPPDVRG